MTKTKLKGGRKARHVVRRQYKSLKSAAVHPATDAKYRKAVSDFFEYLRILTGQEAARSLQNVLEIDICLCDYLQHLWESDASKGDANSAVAGVPHLVPPLTNQLQGARRLLKAWGRTETPLRAPPTQQWAGEGHGRVCSLFK